METRRTIGNAAAATALAALILSMPPLGTPAPRGQAEDCVAAVVNGAPITLVDLRIVQRFGLVAADPGPASLSAVLDKLIEQKLVSDFARGPSAPSPGEIAQAGDEARRKIGPEAWAAALAEFGIAEADLGPFIVEMVDCRKAVAARFSQAAPVTIKEIEDYYRDVYVPERRAAGEEPPPLVQVLDTIESRLQQGKREKLVADWIGNLKAKAEILVNRACLE